MSFLCFINFLMFCNGRADTLQAFTIIVLTSVGRLLTCRWSGGVQWGLVGCPVAFGRVFSHTHMSSVQIPLTRPVTIAQVVSFERRDMLSLGKTTTVSILNDAQRLLNKQQQIWCGMASISTDIFRAVLIR